MLGPGPSPVKPKPLPEQGICPVPEPTADWVPARPDCPVSLPVVLLIVVVAAAALAWLLRRFGGRRQRAMSRLLDAADALEERLRTARAEIEAITGSDDNPVREPLQEMLRQRLWLQQYGDTASLQQLDAVRASIEVARLKIDQQLLQIERARAPMH